MLALHLQRSLEAAAAPSIERVQQDQERAPVRLKPLLTYIEEHLFDPVLDVNHLKRSCGVRDNSVPLQFHSVLGRPPHGYIEDRRLETAKRLLRDSELKVWQIADLLGYSSIQVFSRAFARWSGDRPTAFRKRSRQALDQPETSPMVGGRREVGHLNPHDSFTSDPESLRSALAGKLPKDLARQLIERLLELYPASAAKAPAYFLDSAGEGSLSEREASA